MTEADAGGLRERKKRATQTAIEHAAVELALTHGYERLTVDMTCEATQISQRTFFNYVGSKKVPCSARTHRYPARGLQAAFVVAAAFTEIGATHGDLLQKRRQIVQANPELALKEFVRIEEAEDSIRQLVRERLRADSGGTEREEEAKMVVSLTFGIMHYVARAWMETGFPTISVR